MKGSLTTKIAIFVIILLSPDYSHSLHVRTHEILNQKIAMSDIHGFSLDTYLKDYVGFYNGIYASFGPKGVDRWLLSGGRREDIPYWYMPYLRSVNHFHNPLTDNGYTGFWDTGILSGDSAIRWGQWARGTQTPGGYYSWLDVRDYYLNALTSQTGNSRDANFVETFEGIGRLMHLVQDMSVPEHARDDTHLLPGYEEWLPKVAGGTFGTVLKFDFDFAVANPIYPNASVTVRPSAFGSTAPVPIANLFDSNQYNGTNPDLTIQDNVGLSEYTVANFISPDTIFSPAFPHPAWSSVESYDEPVGFTGKKKMYLRKIREGETIEHFAAAQFLYDDMPPGNRYLYLFQDDNVKADYMRKLIPRAVGYSAELLRYFFRGTLELAAPAEYVYSVIDGSGNPQQFTKVKVRIKNTTQNENIIGGKFQAVAKYKKRIGYQSDLSADPPAASDREDAFSYSVSNDNNFYGTLVSTTFDNNSSVDLSFDFSNNPIPAGITDLYIFVVYKGTIGYEDNIAIAVGMKDLMEPVHCLYFNLTDMYSLNNHLYTAEQIKLNPSLATLVDPNHNGIFNEPNEPYIDPYDQVYRVGFSDNNYQNHQIFDVVEGATVPPGRFFKLITLVDRLDGNYTKFSSYSAVNPYWDDAYVGFNGVANQYYVDRWNAYPDPIATFRRDFQNQGIRNHYASGWLSCLPAVSPDMCPYAEPESIPLSPGNEVPIPVNVTF